MTPNPIPAGPSPDLERLLASLPDGGAGVADRLVPLLYDELRRIARRELRRERPGHTLSTTALVHEAYLRLAGPSELSHTDRARFLAASAIAMRRVLIDHARRQQAGKRGGAWKRVSLSGVALAAEEPGETLLVLDGALQELSAANPRLATVVDCRFFGGMTEEETAVALGVTARTIRRDWLKAKAWLAHSLDAAQADSP